jgi:DNA repair ATPase RecN
MDAGIGGSSLSSTRGKRLDWLDTGEQVLTPSSANQFQSTRKYHALIAKLVVESSSDTRLSLKVWEWKVQELTIESWQ